MVNANTICEAPYAHAAIAAAGYCQPNRGLRCTEKNGGFLEARRYAIMRESDIDKNWQRCCRASAAAFDPAIVKALSSIYLPPDRDSTPNPELGLALEVLEPPFFFQPCHNPTDAPQLDTTPLLTQIQLKWDFRGRRQMRAWPVQGRVMGLPDGLNSPASCGQKLKSPSVVSVLFSRETRLHLRR